MKASIKWDPPAPRNTLLYKLSERWAIKTPLFRTELGLLTVSGGAQRTVAWKIRWEDVTGQMQNMRAEIFVHQSQVSRETKLPLLGAVIQSLPQAITESDAQPSAHNPNSCSMQSVQKQNFKCTGGYIGFKFRICVCCQPTEWMMSELQVITPATVERGRDIRVLPNFITTFFP